MAGYSHKSWSCPFFLWDEKTAVHGECGCLRFRNFGETTFYTDRYCANETGWRYCTAARSLLLWYERDEVYS